LPALAGCSSPYEIRLSDGRSVSRGPVYFFGWADPPLVTGTRLVDAREGQRLVLWNDAFEAIVDVGEECPVLVREGEGARTPTTFEFEALAAVLPGWPLVSPVHPERYAEERRLARRFPSHIRAHFERLDPSAAVAMALGDDPAGWLDLGGRDFALAKSAERASPDDLRRIVARALTLEEAGRRRVLKAVLARPEVASEDLVRAARAGAIDLALVHPAADEAVCLAALEIVRTEPLSSARRRGLEAILDSKGATARVRERVLEVPLAYPEDREAIRTKAATAPR
jgi:hypothetical protein